MVRFSSKLTLLALVLLLCTSWAAEKPDAPRARAERGKGQRGSGGTKRTRNNKRNLPEETKEERLERAEKARKKAARKAYTTTDAPSISPLTKYGGKYPDFSIPITKDNFDDYVRGSNIPALLGIFSDNKKCTSCPVFKKTWDQLAKDQDLKNIVMISSSSSDTDPEILGWYKKKGVPQVVLARKWWDPVFYTGSPDYESVRAWIDHQLVVPHVTLRYFNTRGRAEVLRLGMELGGIEYEQQLFTGEQWNKDIKKAGLQVGFFKFGQVPSLSWDSTHLSQTSAILRFIGRHTKMYIEREQDCIDQWLGGVEDLRQKYGKLVYSSEFEDLKEEYITKTLPTWLGFFEAGLKTKKVRGSLFFCGAGVSIADLAVFDVVGANLALDQNALEDFPRLDRHFEAIKGNKRIRNYLISERRPEFQNGASAFFDNEKTPSGFELFSAREKFDLLSLVEAEKQKARVVPRGRHDEL